MTENVSGKLIASFKAMINKYKYAEKPKEKPSGPQGPGRADGSAKALEKKAEPHPYLRNVKGEHAFKLKTDHHSVIADVRVIEGLRDALKSAPDEAIVFHMNGRNDFANWVKDCVGDWWLGSRMEKIGLTDPSTTRTHLVKTLDERIARLRAH